MALVFLPLPKERGKCANALVRIELFWGTGCGIVFSLDLVCGGGVFGEVRHE